MTTDEAVLALEKVCDALLDCERPSADHRRLTAEKERLEALILSDTHTTEEPTMPRKATLTEQQKKDKARAYQREWARKKAAEKKGATEFKRALPEPIEAEPVTLVADAGGLQINLLRRRIWTLMAQIEEMSPAERQVLLPELGLLDAAAHAAHQLAAGRLEVA